MRGYDKMLLAILGYLNELQCTKGTEDMHAEAIGATVQQNEKLEIVTLLIR